MGHDAADAEILHFRHRLKDNRRNKEDMADAISVQRLGKIARARHFRQTEHLPARPAFLEPGLKRREL